MKRIIVQIYEVQAPSEAEALIEAGVDHIGSVVLSEENWKIPQIRDTIERVHALGAGSSLILLFSGRNSVFCALDYYRPDIVHFCEELTDDSGISENSKKLTLLQENIKIRFPEIRIMRSIPIPPPGSADLGITIELARMFEPVSDYFLTDTLLVKESGSSFDYQPVRGFVGITGQTCDWDIAERLVETSSIPVILAGGISPDNVFAGIMRVRPAGVDSCTGTNASDAQGNSIRFKKDPDKVKRLVKEVRRAEEQRAESNE